jgi:hypothetical protein
MADVPRPTSQRKQRPDVRDTFDTRSFGAESAPLDQKPVQSAQRLPPPQNGADSDGYSDLPADRGAAGAYLLGLAPIPLFVFNIPSPSGLAAFNLTALNWDGFSGKQPAAFYDDDDDDTG